MKMRDIITLIEAPARQEHVFSAFRWHNKINTLSTKLRLGTWYAASEGAAERYQNRDVGIRLGGRTRSSGRIVASNPYFVKLRYGAVLYDARDALPFWDDISAFMDLDPDEEPEGFAAEVARLVADPLVTKAILKLTEFTIRTMVTERVAARWCRTNGYDLLVMGPIRNHPLELFDFMGLFQPE